MARTIVKHPQPEWGPTALPDWARANAAVVELCELNPSYRARVCRAKTEHWRRYLAHMAERCMANMAEAPSQ